MVSLSIEGSGEKRTIAGTLFEGTPRIVRMRDYQVDFTPTEHMLLLAYEDRPGMIGKIGTIMGQHDINIAAMYLGRREKRGEAMVILSLDSSVPGNVIEEVKQATSATFIKTLHMESSK
jgi:D-3-phosphoglycerate dehydrogenase